MRRLFVDLDGVLADMDGYYLQQFGESSVRSNPRPPARFWSNIRRHGTFFRELPLLPDARELWQGVEHLQPTILTGVPSRIPNVEEHKRAWVAQHFGLHVPVICCASVDKRRHGRPGDVLIDDWHKYQNLWVEMGGVFILHTSARTSLERLAEVMP